MWEWIAIALLYVLGMGFFQWLGGLGAAAEALERWGRASAERRGRTSSSSSLPSAP
jgi:hypothetical protein